jgi:hypothetical protein
VEAMPGSAAKSVAKTAARIERNLFIISSFLFD